MDNGWDYISRIDDELLKGGLIENEAVLELVRNADIAFVHGAYWAAIATAAAIIEVLLSKEYDSPSLKTAIDSSDLDEEFKQNLHALRRARNMIMHRITEVEENDLLDEFEAFKCMQEENAKNAIVCMRKILYRNQIV